MALGLSLTFRYDRLSATTKEALTLLNSGVDVSLAKLLLDAGDPAVLSQINEDLKSNPQVVSV